MPAVQYVREAARRTTCQNNVRQIALAIQNFESENNSLPSLYNGSFLDQPRSAIDEFHFHSWRVAILPQLERGSLYDSIDLSLPATNAANQDIVNTPIPTFICPSTVNRNKAVSGILTFNDGQFATQVVGTAARSDYEVIGGVSFLPSGTLDLQNIKFGAWGEPQSYDITQQLKPYRKPQFKDISDGLSNTILIGERAGRPDMYSKGKLVDAFPYTDPNRATDHHQAAWGISPHFWWLVSWHEQPINESNANGLYSLHTAGANVGLADGSVRFLSDTIDQETLNALQTRSEGDLVSLD
jgi:prepilin-type processing-associated H-X9-DG protein